MSDTQILTADQMRAAEQRIFDAGTSVGELMEIAAGGAAEWVRRIAAGRSVSVLCGPGNNGGDGYVIARRLKQAGLNVQVVAPIAPKTPAAIAAKAAWGDDVLTSGGQAQGDVFVDCLLGSGLSRPLSAEHALLLRDLAARHAKTIAVDVPSGIASDDGAVLNDKLPRFDVTLALGAWKFAHWSLPGRLHMGTMRLVPIGVDGVQGAAQLVTRPQLAAPAVDAHKYSRALVTIVAGVMPGAAQLSAQAAMRSGAGYVKMLSDAVMASLCPSVVQDNRPLEEALADRRINAVLVGPGLGRDSAAQARLRCAIGAGMPIVLDADALTLLEAGDLPADTIALATPHEGELERLCKAFAVIGASRLDRVRTLAKASNMVILAKGPDSIIAAPDGRIAVAPPAPSWLATAGSGDVLAGIALSRLAVTSDPYTAACEAVWLHGEAARRAGAGFTALDLAQAASAAWERCL